MSAESTPGGPDNDLDEQRPEHDSVTPALEDEPTADEVGGGSDAGASNAGDDELNSGRIEPGAPQAGV